MEEEEINKQYKNPIIFEEFIKPGKLIFRLRTPTFCVFCNIKRNANNYITNDSRYSLTVSYVIDKVS